MKKIFSNAVQQLIEYIDDSFILGDSKKFSKQYDLHFLKPKGILVIGRNEEIEKFFNLQYYFHNIDIFTYDHILARAKSIISRLKKQDKTKISQRKKTGKTKKGG